MGPSTAGPTSRIVIRAARECDAEVLRELKQTVVDETWGTEHPQDAVDAWKSRFATVAYFVSRITGLDGLDSMFFLAGADDAPVGMAAVKLRDGAGYIGDVYVTARNQGIGSQLLRHALVEAARRGLHRVVADVFEGNEPAIHVLRSHGFVPEDEYLESSLGIRVIRFSMYSG